MTGYLHLYLLYLVLLKIYFVSEDHECTSPYPLAGSCTTHVNISIEVQGHRLTTADGERPYGRAMTSLHHSFQLWLLKYRGVITISVSLVGGIQLSRSPHCRARTYFD